MAGIDDFKAQLTGGGVPPSRFEVVLNSPNLISSEVELNTNLATFMVDAAQLPGSDIGTIPVPFRGRILKVAGDRTFEPWQTTIINDTNFSLRDAMERWMNVIGNHADTGGAQIPSLYFSDLIVRQFDRDYDGRYGSRPGPIKEYFIKDAWPSQVSPIDLGFGLQDQIERFTVIWQYQYWTARTTDS